MFLLIKTGVCFESCGVNARSELVAKCEYKDVLGVVITQALRSAYETALAENDVLYYLMVIQLRKSRVWMNGYRQWNGGILW